MTEPRCAVLGNPVEHSLSPRIFSWLSKELGMPLSYEALQVSEDALAGVFAEARAGGYLGFSITLPLKELAARSVEHLSPGAQEMGAVNCVLRRPDGSLEGHNTDGEGVVKALGQVGTSFDGASVLVLGAGGAARAAVFSALREGARSVTVANRTVARAQALVSGQARAQAIALEGAALEAALASASIVVQATSVGLAAKDTQVLPAPLGFRRGTTVLDMVYRPLDTALLRRARSDGARTVDGLWMLVYQALAQLRIWTGLDVADKLGERLHAHLAEMV